MSLGAASKAQWAAASPAVGLGTSVLGSAAAAGLYRSRNGGAHWETIDAGLLGRNVAAVAAHPIRPLTLYVALLANTMAGTGGGPFTSADGEHTGRRRAAACRRATCYAWRWTRSLRLRSLTLRKGAGGKPPSRPATGAVPRPVFG